MANILAQIVQFWQYCLTKCTQRSRISLSVLCTSALCFLLQGLEFGQRSDRARSVRAVGRRRGVLGRRRSRVVRSGRHTADRGRPHVVDGGAVRLGEALAHLRVPGPELADPRVRAAPLGLVVHDGQHLGVSQLRGS